MPPALASREDVTERLFAVFREHGFEGASLADLSRATGLGKSSLYHHFPEGKRQMAEAVLARAVALVDEAFLGVAQTSEPLRMRLRRVVAALDQFYAGGHTRCVLGQLSGAEIGPTARLSLQRAFEDWMRAIAILARDSGMTAPQAQVFAEDWVARLQGALILEAAIGRAAPFERALEALLDLGKDKH